MGKREDEDGGGRWRTVVLLFCEDCRFEESVCVLVLVSRFVRSVLSLKVFCFLRFGFAERGER